MADQVRIFRPYSTIETGGWVQTEPVTGTHDAYLRDNAWSTRVSPYPNNPNVLKLGFKDTGGGAWTIPARAQVRAVRPAITADCVTDLGAGDGRISIQARVWVGTTAMPHMETMLIRASEGMRARQFPARRTNPWGEPWSQKDIDNLRFHMRRWFFGDMDRPRVAEAYLDVIYNEAPVVTVTGPPDPVTDTSMPTITWTYADPEGDEQEAIHAYVYPESVYSQPGFSVPSPDMVRNFAGVRRPPGHVWTSGTEDAPIVWGTAQSIQVTTPLPNGRYRAYVMARDVGSNGRYSPPAYKEWSQNAPAPLPPTVTVEVQ